MPKLFLWIRVWIFSFSRCLAQAKKCEILLLDFIRSYWGLFISLKLVHVLSDCAAITLEMFGLPLFSLIPGQSVASDFWFFFFFWKHSNSVCTISSSGANTLFQKPKCGNGYKSFLCHVCSMLSFSNCAYIRQLEELEEDSCHLWMPLQLCGEKPRETRNNVNMGWGF